MTPEIGTWVEVATAISLLFGGIFYMAKVTATVRTNSKNIEEMEGDIKTLKDDVTNIKMQENTIVTKLDAVINSSQEIQKQNQNMIGFLQDLIKNK
jgi:uncharacterized protein YoxC